MPCFRHTTERRISQISADMAKTFQNDWLNFHSFSQVFDEFTDIQDNPQLAILARYISSEMTIKEAFFGMVALKETTGGIDIKKCT